MSGDPTESSVHQSLPRYRNLSLVRVEGVTGWHTGARSVKGEKLGGIEVDILPLLLLWMESSNTTLPSLYSFYVFHGRGTSNMRSPPSVHHLFIYTLQR